MTPEDIAERMRERWAAVPADERKRLAREAAQAKWKQTGKRKRKAHARLMQAGRASYENMGGRRPGAGRPAQLTPCPRCGADVTRTQARRGHGCRTSETRQ